MATRARSSQGVIVSVHTSDGTPKNITAITQANPAVVTSTAHGLATGDLVTIAAVGGMTALNGNTYIIEVLTANTFELAGVNSTGLPAYTSGGTATPLVMTQMCEIDSLTANDPGSQLVEVSTICSTAKEFIAGLPDDGTATFNFNWVPSDTGIAKLWTLRDSGNADYFRIRVPATTTDAEVWYASVKAIVQAASRLPTIGTNVALKGNGSLKLSGGVTILVV